MATLSIHDRLRDAISSVVGEARVEAFVEQAVTSALRNRELDVLLAELIEEVGPIPPDLEAEADGAWRAF